MYRNLIYIPVPIPIPLYKPLKRLQRKLRLLKVPNILGDRDVEYSFAIRHLPQSGDRALDFGSGDTYVPLILARFFNEVVALDREKTQFFWSHPKVKEVQADILEDDLPYTEYFDVITNISSVEHVGLAGRYGTIKNTPDGDLIAMKKLYNWLKKGGIHLLTVPVGRDAVYMPLCRVYGENRLPLLLEGYKVVHEEYWAKPGKDNKWYPVEKAYALNYETSVRSWSPAYNIYALGCFVLQK